MYESHFSPYYALPTSHPYPQYTGDVTYPGPSILSVGKFFQQPGFWPGVGMAAGALVLLAVALMAMGKLKLKLKK